MRRRGSWVGALALVIAGASQVGAQTYHGGIRGAVRDTGGVVPGATVTLTNEASGSAWPTVTNEVGEYAFPNVTPGTYALATVLSGYKTFESRGLLIGTQDFLVVDVTLEIGDIAEHITVTGETPRLNAANASVASLLDRVSLERLPTMGRNPFLFSTTIANVVPLGTPFFTRMQDQNASSLLSIAGGAPRSNTFLLDGVPITDLLNRAAMIPSIEALEEVSVQVNTYDASFGRSGGGVFNSTHRSGGNEWHGGAMLRNRPDWGIARGFFASKRGVPKPESYNYLWSGSLGGPIVRNRTFVFGTTEGYRTREVRDTVLFLPTALERIGDFSRSVDALGRPLVIFDPRTTRPNPAVPGQFIRDAFPGNVIPADRIDPVARQIASLYPLPEAGQRSTRSAPVSDLARQATVKLDHRAGSRYALAASYAWYASTEPSPRFFGGLPSDWGVGEGLREVHLVGLNHLFTTTGATVYEVRYGFLTFADDYRLPAFDVSSLPFAQAFKSQVPVREFPTVFAAPYTQLGTGFPSADVTFPSHTLNATMTRLIGRHTVKVGGDYRRLGLERFEPGNSGVFSFTRAFTQGPNPNVAATNAGDSIASLLLGFPASGTVTIGTPQQFHVRYYGAFVHDDVRVRSNLTLNLGLRYEYEMGLREAQDGLTVGFDRERPFPVQVPGLNLKGGLMYAGVDGYPTHQSDPTASRFGPRAGVAWSPGPRTVVRGGYGLFWAPPQFAFPNDMTLGTRGFTASTPFFASADGNVTPCDRCSLVNPFPDGIQQPVGNTLGLLTGVGGRVDFNDQFRRSPYIHKFSADVQRELPHGLTVILGYVGSRSERLDISGSVGAGININQVDPRFQTLGPALQARVPNPFFNNPAFGAFSASPTIDQAQLLRPYPQFGDVFAHQVSAGRARYHSFVAEGRRQFREGWGARVNYTWSRTNDNVVGEQNFFSFRGAPNQVVMNSYDLDGEFGRSLSDAPHRLNMSGTWDLPFGAGRRWLNDRRLAGALTGGWTATLVGTYQSGFPIRVLQDNTNSGLLGAGQRPNIVPDVAPLLTGEPTYDPSCQCVRWLNPQAWSQAPAFTFGNAPRIDARIRTPRRLNWDVALQKTHRVAGQALTVRAEAINVLNDAGFGGAVNGFGRSDFGQITTTSGVPRTLQLMARWQF